jgi:hypothetical protein
MKILIPLVTLLIVILGCSKDRAEKSNGPSKDPAITLHPKIHIQSEKNGSQTGVYLNGLELTSKIHVNGKPVAGSRKLQLTNQAGYPGKNPSCVEDNLVMIFAHTKYTNAGWQFPKEPNIVLVADAIEYSFVRILHSPIEKEGKEYWESVIMVPSCEMLSKIKSSNEVGLKIGTASITFDNDTLYAVKSYVSAIGL